MPKGGTMELFGFVATEKGGTDGHAAAYYTSAQLGRTVNIRYIVLP